MPTSHGSQYFGMRVAAHHVPRMHEDRGAEVGGRLEEREQLRRVEVPAYPQCEPICTPCSPSCSMQRSISWIASVGDCSGTVPMPA